MAIAFVTSCLAPAKDGVGDQLRPLAAGIQALGRPCRLLALHDPYVEQPHAGELTTEAGPIPCLRLPRAMPWKEREPLAHEFLRQHGATWFSLQFVPYAWHRRGLVGGWRAPIARLARPFRRHVMLHETWTWLGAYVGAPLRLRLLGAVQKHFIASFFRSYDAEVAHTHVPVYAEMYRSIGVRAGLLPIFSAIPIAPRDDAWLLRELAAHGVPSAAENRERFWLGGFFGTLYPDWEAEPFFSRLREAARRCGRRVCLICAGNTRGSGERWAALRAANPDFFLPELGELSLERASQFFQALDFGVAVTPWMVMPKSSVACALLEHGVPTLVTRDDWRWGGGPNPPPPDDPLLIRAFAADFESRLLAGLPRRAPHWRREEMARRYVDALPE